jgi:uncharacterized protein (DUF1499 family)
MKPKQRPAMTLWSAVVAVFAALVAAFFIAGPEHAWRLAGPADLGPVAFESLQRRSSPNDALACPPDICTARSDIVPPVFDVRATALRQAFEKAMASEPRLEKVASDDAALTDRYVQRTKVMGFPDTIVVRFFDLADGRSTLALYSRSQLGEGDFGVNKARIKRWLDKLAKEAPAVATI